MDAAITVASPWKSVMNGRFSIKSRNPWEARTMCQTWPTSTNIARVFSWSAARERDEMLELYDRKLSRTVLRRESGSNPADLAGKIRQIMHNITFSLWCHYFRLHVTGGTRPVVWKCYGSQARFSLRACPCSL